RRLRHQSVWQTGIACSHSRRFTTIARLGDFRAAHILDGRPRGRFRNTKDPIGEKSRSPDSQRIRPSALPGLARRQTGPPPGTAAGGMGTPDYGDQTDYLRVFITHLRKKIEPNPATPQSVRTEP